MRHTCVTATMTVLVMATGVCQVYAQDQRRMYVGALFGVSTLSADARSVTTQTSASASTYKPENGPALNVFAGVHLGRYVTLQGNYVFDSNDLTLFSSTTSPGGGSFYEQPRTSSQHAFIADTLVYFRALGSGIRPYLGTGLAVVKFRSDSRRGGLVNGISPPEGPLSSTKVALRSHVGIDFAISRAWAFRYSFSETIGGNPISPHLTPAGRRGLANFQNLWGVLARF